MERTRGDVASGGRLGLITNPNSRRNRRYLPEVRELVRQHSGVMSREATEPEALHAAVTEMVEAGVSAIAVNGGDGTSQAVLTTLLAESSAPQVPALVLLRGGTTNMNADDVGPSGKLLRALRRTLECCAPGAPPAASCQRPILRVEANGGALVRCGMFFGAGAIVNGIEYCHRRVHSKGLKDGLAPGICTLRVLYAMARSDRSLVPPVAMRISPTPVPPWEFGEAGVAEQLLVLATTLERLFLGLRPYWGEQREGFHFTALRAQPVAAWRVMPPLFWGRPGRAATPENGYASGRFEAADIEMDGSITLDGEIYRVHKAQGPVRLSVAGRIRFLQP